MKNEFETIRKSYNQLIFKCKNLGRQENDNKPLSGAAFYKADEYFEKMHKGETVSLKKFHYIKI